jgi:hypothetical protein
VSKFWGNWRAGSVRATGSTATTTPSPPGGGGVELRVIDDKTHGTLTCTMQWIKGWAKTQKPRQQEAETRP